MGVFLLNSCFRMNENGSWAEDAILEGHSDWVRDVAWAPQIGLYTTTIATCSQVNTCSFILG